MASDETRSLLLTCMLVASRNDGKIPVNENYIKRIGHLKRKPNFKSLIDLGFLEIPLADDSVMQADASTLQAVARPETETYREETEKRHIEYTESVREKKYSDEFEHFWSIYPKNGASKFIAYQSFTKAIQKGTSHEEIIRSVSAYTEYLSRSEIKTAHATTWLNQSRWTVDYAAIPNCHKRPSPTTNALAALYEAGNNLRNKQQSSRMEPATSFQQNEKQAGDFKAGTDEIEGYVVTRKH